MLSLRGGRLCVGPLCWATFYEKNEPFFRPENHALAETVLDDDGPMVRLMDASSAPKLAALSWMWF